MKWKTPRKVIQQNEILLLALYLLKNCLGIHSPPKPKVLSFIRANRLMHIPETDYAARSNRETTWENDLSWKRENLKEQGFLLMPQVGIWQLTDKGEREVEAWADRVKRKIEANPNWRAIINGHTAPAAEFDNDIHVEFYLTETAVGWALKIASGECRQAAITPTTRNL